MTTAAAGSLRLPRPIEAQAAVVDVKGRASIQIHLSLLYSVPAFRASLIETAATLFRHSSFDSS